MSHRMQQINSLLKETLGEIFTLELETPSSFLITISKVETVADLKTAKVWLSILPFDKSQEGLALVVRKKKDIQHELGKKIKLKFTPKLEFIIDDTQQRVAEIESLIDGNN